MNFVVRFTFLTEDNRLDRYKPHGIDEECIGGLRLLDEVRAKYGEDVRPKDVYVQSYTATSVEVELPEAEARALGDLFADVHLVDVQVYYIKYAPSVWQTEMEEGDIVATIYPSSQFLLETWKAKGCPKELYLGPEA